MARAREAGYRDAVRGGQDLVVINRLDADEKAAFEAGRTAGQTELNWLAVQIASRGQYVQGYTFTSLLHRVQALEEAAKGATDGEV